MALFRKSEPEPAPPRVTGVDVLRQALRNRNSRVNGMQGLKDELKAPFAAITDFINGSDSALTGEQLDRAAKHMWGGAVEFDSESQMLRAKSQPAKPLGVRYDGPTPINLGVVLGPTGAPPPGPRLIMATPAKAGPVWPRREGWA
jgi:hypothetical protein